MSGDRRLIDAIVSVASDVSLSLVLRRIIESACDLIGARYGALGVLDEKRESLSEFITFGMDRATVDEVGALPAGRGVLGRLVVHPRPIRVRDVTKHPDAHGFPPHHPPMRSFLGVPIRSRDTVFGNLYVAEKIGAPEFTPEDEEMLAGLAGAAAVAIDNARLQARVRASAVHEDRERIARDLHDTVIQRLYATGMTLTATLPMVDHPDAAERISQAVTDLDDTIRDIRSSIFALQAADRGTDGLRADVLALVQRAQNTLGFLPAVTFDGPVDTAVPDVVGDHLLAALRESLTNVAKHARASRAWVLVAATAEVVELVVSDDGRGLPEDRTRSSGLANLADRAGALGGDFAVGERAGGGTESRWRVPLLPG